MISTAKYKPQVVVVDSMPQDYSNVVQNNLLNEVEVRFVSTGREALRTSYSNPPDLWVINTHLVDMTGLELYAMLTQHGSSKNGSAKGSTTRAYLVGDTYQAQEEIEVRMQGIPFYLCKPLAGDWLANAIKLPLLAA